MPVATTSRQAYLEEYARLTGKRKQVFECIKTWPLPSERPSIEDLSDHLKMRVASVCGRLGELKESGLIIEGDTKRSKTTGKRVKTYLVAPVPSNPQPEFNSEQGELFSLPARKSHYDTE